VLEAIYPDELEKLSDEAIQISVAPEEQVPGEELKLLLHVEYPPEYPEVTPTLSITVEEGELSQEEENLLVATITASAMESIGMAQTFTIVSALIEGIGTTVKDRVNKKDKAKAEKEKAEEEAELRRIRGTPVTPAAFIAWRDKFNKERKIARQKRDEEYMKEMSNKEREEYKKYASRLTGRQLFERNRDLAMSDDALVEEGTEAVDITQYSRDEVEDDENEKENEALHFSDSD